MRAKTLAVGLLAVLALLLAACGDEAGGNDAALEPSADDVHADHVMVAATEFEFDPADVSIPADTPTTVMLENNGVVEHDWTVEGTDIEIYTEPGESNAAEVELPAGEYTVYCSIPGHRDAGMEGTLTVE